ncbi:hypothetical protein OG232_04780 [Streptomyces sp. NBC_01411]|uniref:hypothetical protein n=1 Tax=Streptomyces sp. NBC_01411 TaxID=2903857 RepID=UPI0032464961
MFDPDTATRFRGNLPGDDHAWEDVYRTEDGSWVKNRVVFTNKIAIKGRILLGKPDVSIYTAMTEEDARTWLTDNDYAEAVKRHFERPKGGRPSIGEKLITRVPARMHNEISDLAEMYDEDMPETVRRLLSEALGHRRIIGAPGSRQEG